MSTLSQQQQPPGAPAQQQQQLSPPRQSKSTSRGGGRGRPKVGSRRRPDDLTTTTSGGSPVDVSAAPRRGSSQISEGGEGGVVIMPPAKATVHRGQMVLPTAPPVASSSSSLSSPPPAADNGLPLYLILDADAFVAMRSRKSAGGAAPPFRFESLLNLRQAGFLANGGSAAMRADAGSSAVIVLLLNSLETRLMQTTGRDPVLREEVLLTNRSCIGPLVSSGFIESIEDGEPAEGGSPRPCLMLPPESCCKALSMGVPMDSLSVLDFAAVWSHHLRLVRRLPSDEPAPFTLLVTGSPALLHFFSLLCADQRWVVTGESSGKPAASTVDGNLACMHVDQLNRLFLSKFPDVCSFLAGEAPSCRVLDASVLRQAVANAAAARTIVVESFDTELPPLQRQSPPPPQHQQHTSSSQQHLPYPGGFYPNAGFAPNWPMTSLPTVAAAAGGAGPGPAAAAVGPPSTAAAAAVAPYASAAQPPLSAVSASGYSDTLTSLRQENETLKMQLCRVMRLVGALSRRLGGDDPDAAAAMMLLQQTAAEHLPPAAAAKLSGAFYSVDNTLHH